VVEGPQKNKLGQISISNDGVVLLLLVVVLVVAKKRTGLLMSRTSSAPSSSSVRSVLDAVKKWMERHQQSLLAIVAVLLVGSFLIFHQPRALTESENLVEALKSHSEKLIQEHAKLNEELHIQSKENHYLREWMRQMHNELMYTSEEYRNTHTAENLQLLPAGSNSPGNKKGDELHMVQQAYTVVIPAGISGGQEFEVDVNNIIYIVMCPENGRSGQTVAFDIPTPNIFTAEQDGKLRKEKVIGYYRDQMRVQESLREDAESKEDKRQWL